MIERDRELLARLHRFNRATTASVVAMIDHQDGGVLPAEGWRRLAAEFRVMADVFAARALVRDE